VERSAFSPARSNRMTKLRAAPRRSRRRTICSAPARVALAPLFGYWAAVWMWVSELLGWPPAGCRLDRAGAALVGSDVGSFYLDIRRVLGEYAATASYIGMKHHVELLRVGLRAAVNSATSCWQGHFEQSRFGREAQRTWIRRR
jgi:hypothetical protein